MRSSLRFLGMGAVALGVLGAGTAAAAPGGGAVSAPATCLISVPGYPDATGTGRVVSTPNGGQSVSCQAQYPVGTALPAKTVKYEVGACFVIVNSNGKVTAHC